MATSPDVGDRTSARPGATRARRTLLGWLMVSTSLVVPAQPAPSTDAAAGAVEGAAGDETAANDAPFEGRVAAYLLSPEAGVGGLVFDDGRQVAVPPRLGAQLAALLQPGQRARVGAGRDDPPGRPGLRSITAVASGLTLAESPDREAPRTPNRAPGDAIALQPMKAAGAIRIRLRGPRGEVNGLLLDNGTQVFFPPHVAREASAWLRPGLAIQVDGYGRRSRYGTVLQATTIAGPGGRTVAVYGRPDPRPGSR